MSSRVLAQWILPVYRNQSNKNESIICPVKHLILGFLNQNFLVLEIKTLSLRISSFFIIIVLFYFVYLCIYLFILYICYV